MFFILWLPNIRLAELVLFEGDMDILKKLSFLFLSPLMFGSNFTFISALIAVLISVLFGINVAMLAYHFNFRYGGAGIAGMVSGLFGVGCFSCGSVLLPLFGLSGAALVLPFHGQEFNVVAIALLLVSIYLTSNKISRKTCAEN